MTEAQKLRKELVGKKEISDLTFIGISDYIYKLENTLLKARIEIKVLKEND